MILELIQKNKIIPVLVIEDINQIDTVFTQLEKADLLIAEITLRTPCALEAIILAKKKFPHFCVGAGTAINLKQVKDAFCAGADFIVSPGFDKKSAAFCKKKNVLYIPGCVTPTELMQGINCGLSIFKFFPASAYGGAKSVKALTSVFRNIQFIPTGGIDDKNLSEYLQIKQVLACGSSWMLNGTEQEIFERTQTMKKIVKEYI